MRITVLQYHTIVRCVLCRNTVRTTPEYVDIVRKILQVSVTELHYDYCYATLRYVNFILTRTVGQVIF